MYWISLMMLEYLIVIILKVVNWYLKLVIKFIMIIWFVWNVVKLLSLKMIWLSNVRNKLLKKIILSLFIIVCIFMVSVLMVIVILLIKLLKVDKVRVLDWCFFYCCIYNLNFNLLYKVNVCFYIGFILLFVIVLFLIWIIGRIFLFELVSYILLVLFKLLIEN